MFDKQQSSLVLMPWKKINLDKGEEENRHSERINAPCMGFVLKKKRRKLPTSRQTEKDNIRKTLSLLRAAALKETVKFIQHLDLQVVNWYHKIW